MDRIQGKGLLQGLSKRINPITPNKIDANSLPLASRKVQ
jgi:hypothetical protein